MPGTTVLLIGESLDVIKSDAGLRILPDKTFNDAPQADLLLVPGGKGIYEAMQSPAIIAWLQKQAVNAKYVTSVCTGALVLAAAGLLDGYRATTHWLGLDLLRMFNVEVIEERIVMDRNRITGGGVTAGIDLGLYTASKIFGEEAAMEIQLMIEYNPSPVFNAGSPVTAPNDVVKNVKAARHEIQVQREELVARIVAENKK
jgi:cyclohexyl-isocyanide hydratase